MKLNSKNIPFCSSELICESGENVGELLAAFCLVPDGIFDGLFDGNNVFNLKNYRFLNCELFT
eukprot:UN07451